MARAAGVELEEIKTLNNAIKAVYKSVKNLMTESKMSLIRQEAHNQAVDYNQQRNLLMTLFESAAFIGICGFNLYHIKGMLEKDRKSVV